MNEYIDDGALKEKMYAELKKPIDDKLASYVNHVAEQPTIKYNNIYTISFKKRFILKLGILNPGVWSDSELSQNYAYEERGMVALNLVCASILREHDKIEPVFKFGYNDHLCYDITKKDFFIFFRLLK
jgi:hypothetical protein